MGRGVLGCDGMLAVVPGHPQSLHAACPAPRAQIKAPDLSWAMSTAPGASVIQQTQHPEQGKGICSADIALLSSPRRRKLLFPSPFLSALPHHAKYQRGSGEYLISNLSNQSVRPCMRERVAVLNTKSPFYSAMPRFNYVHKIRLLT